MNIFYLHRSPTTCARWLNDKDAPAVQRYCKGILVNAVHLWYCETQMNIPTFDARYMGPHMSWLMSSVEHVCWVYDLFKGLEERCGRQPDFRFHIQMPSYMRWFPRIPWENPPLTMPHQFAMLRIDDIYKWRLFYGTERKGPYHKVKQPFWLTDIDA